MKNKQTTEPNMWPNAHICIQKSRMKVYHKETNPTYYLNKGTEFSIELFNPTSDVVLAKIILNGKSISQAGLVLRPGQRVFLDRYLDVAKKFLFDTYEVANTTEVKKAIEDNGDIKVEFFKERVPYNYQPLNWQPTHIYHHYYSNPWYNPQPSLFHCGSTGGYSSGAGIYGTLTTTNGMSTTTSYNAAGASSNSASGTFTIGGGNNVANGNTANYSNTCHDSLSFGDVDESPLRASSMSRKISKAIETGRVETGSHSDQNFRTVDKDFEYFAFHTVEYKMLPISQKVNTVDDISIKRYCTSCGAKLGKTDRFCSTCGGKA